MGRWISMYDGLLSILRNGAVIMTNSDLGVHQMEGIIGEVVKTLSL